jgi:Rps23 Pro-64 3,4-dihydroxylase Tpa1-like proline 4-hydroxylase
MEDLYDEEMINTEDNKFNNIINNENINNASFFKDNFMINNNLKISNFLNQQFAIFLFNYVQSNKNWLLATGIESVKYLKPSIPVNDKINNKQIKNVNEAFGKDQFSYIFYRSMNSKNMSYFEFVLRQTLNSPEFINFLNEITGLELIGLSTLFLSKYKSGNFLSPHSDKGNGKLAFVINITPNWKPQYGGILHFMNDERTEIIQSFVPEFNSFVIFNVPEPNGIPHFVSHIAPNVRFNRFAITGWFA